jgi:hypothetical protein
MRENAIEKTCKNKGNDVWLHEGTSCNNNIDLASCAHGTHRHRHAVAHSRQQRRCDELVLAALHHPDAAERHSRQRVLLRGFADSDRGAVRGRGRTVGHCTATTHARRNVTNTAQTALELHLKERCTLQ